MTFFPHAAAANKGSCRVDLIAWLRSLTGRRNGPNRRRCGTLVPRRCQKRHPMPPQRDRSRAEASWKRAEWGENLAASATGMVWKADLLQMRPKDGPGRLLNVAGYGEESQDQGQDLINGHVQTSFVQVKPVLERGAMYKSH